MNRFLTRLTLLTCILPVGGCFWMGDTSLDTGALPDDRPRVERPVSGPSATAPEAAANPNRPRIRPTPAPTLELPEVGETAWSPVEPFIAVLPGGLRIAAGQFPGARHAQIELVLAHPEVSAARASLGRLVAEMIVDTPLDGGGRPSLRRAVENSGGSLSVTADAWATNIRISAPVSSWRWLSRLLADAIIAPPTAPARVEAWRQSLIREYGKTWSEQPIDAAVKRVHAFELRGLEEWLEVLEDVEITDVLAFYAQTYLPSRAMLVFAVPSPKPEAVVELCQEVFAPWSLARGGTSLPAAVGALPPASGLFFGTTEDDPSFVTLVELPPAVAEDAATSWVTAELMIGTSVEGRITEAIDRSVRGLRSSIREDGPVRFLELTGRIGAGETQALRRAVDDAYASLARRAPGAVEIRAAAERARLALAIELGEPRTWCSAVSRSLIAGATPAVILAPDGRKTELPSRPMFGPLIEKISKPESLPIAAKIAARSKERGLVIVLGKDLTDLPEHGSMPGAQVSDARRTVVSADRADQEAAARLVLAHAIDAVGGAAALLELQGFQFESTSRTGQGPEAFDAVWYRRTDRYRRLRHVLNSDIETVIGPDVAVETASSQRRALEEFERTQLLDDVQRHPIALLAEAARGTTRYRQVSLRTVEGRRMAVLERSGDRPGRFRVYVDVESGLLRAVVSSVDTGNGEVFRREEWRDYRGAGRGIRAPHHCTTWIDNGVRGIITVFESFRPDTPDEQWLRLGGPLR
ncbi:MAG: hypothetical protein RL562_800 [Planctomycetota bacterium]